MKYVMFGAGGTGAILGSQLAMGGQDVTLIARGAHGKAIQEKGLVIDRAWAGATDVVPMKCMEADDYTDTPDVIFVCVKGYSLDDVIDFVAAAAGEKTVVIPILNVYGTGEKLQDALPDVNILDGCVYMYAEIKEPGVILQSAPILRLVFGPRDGNIDDPRYEKIAKQCRESGMEVNLSANIRRDALEKFAYVSPVGACGLYFNTNAQSMQREGEERDFLKGMMQEIVDLAVAMDIPFEQDVVAKNLYILDNLVPTSVTSMQRDIAAGHASEVDGLVYEVVRLGERYHVDVPYYRKVADEMESRGL